MKKLTIIIFLAITFQSFAQEFIPNAGFESWIIETVPADWQTTNQFILPDTFNIIKTTDSYSGQYAMQLSTIDYSGIIIPGVATLGILDIGSTYGGIPFNGRPVSFTGYVKHPSTGDEVMIFVEFMKSGNLVGSCSWSTSDSLGSYTQINVPATYFSTEDPDTMNITVLTDSNKPGSKLIIDQLDFEYITGIEKDTQDLVHIYPNPVTDFMYLSGSEKIKTVQIFDLSGKLVLKKDEGALRRLDLMCLKHGVYIMHVHIGDNIIREKLVKQ